MDLDEQIHWKKMIGGWARELGFVAVGFTAAEPIEDLATILQARIDQGWATPFESKEIQQRIDPQAVWPDCQTVVALAYPLPFTVSPQEGEGLISRSAVGEDYHRVVLRKVQELIDTMVNNNWLGLCRFQVDTGPLVERAFATRAGIGWIGRNQQLIIPGVGSFVTLALLLLDQELRSDDPFVFQQCGNCQKCVISCPAQIIGREPFPANKCVSYLTQSKELLTSEEISSLGLQIFGCDVCQEVCPHNQKWLEEEQTSLTVADSSSAARPSFRRGVDLVETLNLTKSEFGQRFKITAAGWRGKGVLQRNAYLALSKVKETSAKQWINVQTIANAIPPRILPYVEREQE
ncbi:tRNA epoxyqueuosine(34) reductase QueG [Desulfosporosinus meridiei]|uniref:Uncharacterized Fe-S protein n=1 Tax=Desulfosporosinus meridiei (strain ATCC BAA-275 / DSM 13257 / KCTC 12902 / NCIMB 13706 / S10) TaxID=768704 RepID=J7J0D2_DESMD|nr:tRNA epoxyqueuosine(34) reductase QueG [Desulfosporosinus meridiei]AFQ44778.1 uncharacterized Fe-S protein [Desulfosporosinus meridiei DSM 13257]